MRIRHRLPRLRHLGLLEASIVPAAEGPGQWWPRQETVTNGRPRPIIPTTQATHRAPTRRGPEATTQGSGDASTPEGFQNLAWSRFRETGRSRTLAPNRAAAVLFLSPLDPKARPPCYPAAATSQRKRAPAACTAPAGRRAGGAAEAGPVRCEAGLGAGLVPGAGPGRRALRGRGSRGEQAGRARRGAVFGARWAPLPGEPSRGRAGPARSPRAFEVVDEGGRSRRQRQRLPGGSPNPPRAMSHRAPGARPRSGQRSAGAPTRPAAAARL